MRPLEPYHHVWLAKHPKRTEQWLREQLKDGFHIHHADGDHQNNKPENLVMVEGLDHFELHGGLKFLLKPRPPKPRKRKKLRIWASVKMALEDKVRKNLRRKKAEEAMALFHKRASEVDIEGKRPVFTRGSKNGWIITS